MWEPWRYSTLIRTYWLARNVRKLQQHFREWEENNGVDSIFAPYEQGRSEDVRQEREGAAIENAGIQGSGCNFRTLRGIHPGVSKLLWKYLAQYRRPASPDTREVFLNVCGQPLLPNGVEQLASADQRAGRYSRGASFSAHLPPYVCPHVSRAGR
jgi:hypothetical protein